MKSEIIIKDSDGGFGVASGKRGGVEQFLSALEEEQLPNGFDRY